MRLKTRMGWTMPWYIITDSFDADFGVDLWQGHNVIFLDGDRVFAHISINSRGDEAMGIYGVISTLPRSDRQETWEDSPEGYPETPPYKPSNWHDTYIALRITQSEVGTVIENPREAEARVAP